MSDSDDDVPLGARVKAVKPKPAKPSKPRVYNDSSSEDDVPLGARVQAKKPAPQKPAKPTSNGHVAKAQPATKPKPAAETGKKVVKKPAAKREVASSQNDKVKKERKVYNLPGQTRETPDETDPLRKFYTSLYEQRPNSQMAKKWLLQVGLLSKDEAHRVMDELARLKTSGLKSPAKPNGRSNGTVKRDQPPKAKAVSKPLPKKGKKRKEESEEEISSSDEEIVPKKKQRRVSNSSEDEFKPQKAKPQAKAQPVKKKPVAKKEQFSDDSSDDDKPLGMRINR